MVEMETKLERKIINQYREALEELAKLGNGDRYGNSEGNRIAQRAIAWADSRLKPAPELPHVADSAKPEVGESSQRPKPFDGPEWGSWHFEASGRIGKGNYAIYGGENCTELWWQEPYTDHLYGEFSSPETARQVAECIEAAKQGKRVATEDDVRELVEALRFAYIFGTWDGVSDILAKWEEKK